MPSLISIKDLSKDQILNICERAAHIEKYGFQNTLSQKIIAPIFFEASTRTKMSFEGASLRCNAQLLSSFNMEHSSLKKGESAEDTIRMIASYSDLIIIRHPQEGFVAYADMITECPVINAGDGANEHPTQTLLDLYTIYKDRGSLENFSICLAGDLRYSRTIHSLIYALPLFNCKIKLVSPQELSLPSDLKNIIKNQLISESDQIIDGTNCDYFYMTRVQKERIPNANFTYENNWILNLSLCQKHAQANLKIMHPLPRINEIDTDLDDSPYQLYFTQSKNGLFTRIAILEYCLGVKL